MGVACFFLDGFSKSNLEGPTVLSVWQDSFKGVVVSKMVLNMWRAEGDSLKRRWARLKPQLDWVRENSPDEIHILAYSLGCHLAVRFLEWLPLRLHTNVKGLHLVAPDPKYYPSYLDASRPSAYKEARRLWKTDPPGIRFSSALKELARTLDPKPVIVYCEDDEVALWRGNTEAMVRTCGSTCDWHPIPIGRDHKVGPFDFRLVPGMARHEFWIHKQLFTQPQPQKSQPQK